MIVLINNAASDLGIAIVRRFAREGAQVIAVTASDTGLEQLHGDARENVRPVSLRGAVNPEAISSALAALPQAWQAIDVLVNNSTLMLGSQPAHQAALDDWDTMIELNCKSMTAMTRALLPRMLACRSGTILNLSSARQDGPMPGSTVYGATVAFVHQYTLSLLGTLADSGVRATCIAPQRETSVALLEVDDAACPRQSQPCPTDALSFVASHADIVETTYWMAMLPPHINLSHMELAQTGTLFSPSTAAQ